jgi:hypothetical protein
MRKHLKTVPIYAPVGHVPVKAADHAVAAGRALSLRGRALLISSRAALEECVSELDLDPEGVADILAIVLRAQRDMIARRQSEGDPEPVARNTQRGFYSPEVR